MEKSFIFFLVSQCPCHSVAVSQCYSVMTLESLPTVHYVLDVGVGSKCRDVTAIIFKQESSKYVMDLPSQVQHQDFDFLRGLDFIIKYLKIKFFHYSHVPLSNCKQIACQKVKIEKYLHKEIILFLIKLVIYYLADYCNEILFFLLSYLSYS